MRVGAALDGGMGHTLSRQFGLHFFFSAALALTTFPSFDASSSFFSLDAPPPMHSREPKTRRALACPIYSDFTIYTQNLQRVTHHVMRKFAVNVP